MNQEDIWQELTHSRNAPGLIIVTLLHHRVQRGGGRGGGIKRGRMRQIAVTGNSLFYRGRITWCCTRAHTFTSCPLLWYSRNSSVDNVYLSFLNHALPDVQSQAGIAWLQGRSWLAKMRRAKNASYYIGQPIHNLITRSSHPASPSQTAPTTAANRRTKGRNSLSE